MSKAIDEERLAAKSTEILALPRDGTTKKAEPKTPAQLEADPARTEQLLAGILDQLRHMQDRERFREFSLMRLLAGLVQVVVPVCLLLALWFLMGARRQENYVFMLLGLATVLQLMALTFYIMHGRR
jgi:hypothetical protein